MRWLKRDGWKVGIALAGLLLLLLLTVLIPLAASAYEGTSGPTIMWSSFCFFIGTYFSQVASSTLLDIRLVGMVSV